MADAPEIEALTPYARSLGISLDRWEDGTPILTVPFDETVEGRPDHYHGGATGGLLETAGYAVLRAELARQDAGDDEKPRHKPFKDYEPGYVHIDIKHLPQMPDEEQKRYLYVAIDRATRWVYLEIRRSQSAKDARAFMKRVEEKAPFKIQTVLTDNDKTFTGRFTRAGGQHTSSRSLSSKFSSAHHARHGKRSASAPSACASPALQKTGMASPGGGPPP